MISSAGQIQTAKYLLAGQPDDPRVRRAISTAYYALFHHLCFGFSSVVLRPSPMSFTRAWLQAYRYPDHGPAKQRCAAAAKEPTFPVEVIKFAVAFVRLQGERIDADYNPERIFTAAEASGLVLTAEQAILDFDRVPAEHQRAFLLFVGLKPKAR
jgi:hypothetical protein